MGHSRRNHAYSDKRRVGILEVIWRVAQVVLAAQTVARMHDIASDLVWVSVLMSVLVHTSNTQSRRAAAIDRVASQFDQANQWNEAQL